ncbi:RICIN domain-containing protein [Streptomyces clavifer]|uniref:RICIN domain-containing protein n=1 Tax=Streptomyces clavifer TaxID=68188 RepID=UPI0037FC2772
MADITSALHRMRTALDGQREEIAALTVRLGLPSRTVVIEGEVLSRPNRSELAHIQGQIPRRAARRMAATRVWVAAAAVAAAAVAAAAAAATAGGWHFAHQQSTSPAAAPRTSSSPLAVASTAPPTASAATAAASAPTKPVTDSPPSNTPTTAPPTSKPPSASPRPVRGALPAVPPTQWGHVTNDNSDLCLAVPAASRQSGKILNQYPCGSYADHYWKTEPAPSEAQHSGSVRIVNYNSRQCLSVADASTDTAAPVVQESCAQTDAQYWNLEDHPDGTWIVNANSGQCLAVPAASIDALVEVNQYPCGDYPDHYWHLEGS